VHEKLQNLEALANPWVIGISGAMYLMEMFADKIPVLDTLWDVLHTLIRPLGAMALALSALGKLPTEWVVIGTLLAGTASATTHAAKMGTRLLTNASPEPVSNFVLSVLEDVAVGTGIFLLFKHPYFTGILCMALLVGLWILIPKVFLKVGGFFNAIKTRLSGKTTVA
jgi:protein-S-isoprenylcysteine O-methyltransferase Ste14